ncbi:MAG: GNAT family N-acetyltransferase [Candidatus Pacebacteria bacterium]|nr:GNAT family N-acetyltransferase [Candidatus Paceibacterota bacterium]
MRGIAIMLHVTIRRLTGADSEGYSLRYLALMQQLTDMTSVSDAMRERYFSSSMDEGFWVFGAFADVTETSNLLGITSVHFRRHMKGFAASIEDVVVDEAHRLRGICRQLITYVEGEMPHFSASKRLQPQGIYKVVLQSAPEAEGLYEKLGYKPDEKGFRKNKWW